MSHLFGIAYSGRLVFLVPQKLRAIEPAGWQRITNEIKAALIFARPYFVNVDA